MKAVYVSEDRYKSLARSLEKGDAVITPVVPVYFLRAEEITELLRQTWEAAQAPKAPVGNLSFEDYMVEVLKEIK